MKLSTQDIITHSPLLIYLLSLLSFLFTSDAKYMWFLVVIVINDYLCRLEKLAFTQILGRSAKRPGNCGSKLHGFPSSHAQTLSFTAMFWTLYLLAEGKYNLDTLVVLKIAMLWILTMIVCYQRIQSKCHTMTQVLVGIVFGMLLAFLSYVILSRWTKKTFPRL